LWQGRPLYYTFSANRLETVQASDISEDDAKLARTENPAFAPYWYSRPRWIWAPLPDDPDQAAKIVQSASFGSGEDVIDMPRYFKPWAAGLPQLRQRLTTLGETKYFSKAEQKLLHDRMTNLGLNAEEKNALVMWGGTARRLVAVFDLKSLKIQALIRPD
jgi:hypothetical protein